jgi:NTE family protein
MLTILIHKETRRQISTMDPQDILIRPELGTFGSTDFAQIMSAIEPGAEAAAAVGDRLQRLALDGQAYAEHVARRPVQGAVEETLAFVRVIHDDGLEDKALQSRVLAKAGDPIDPRRLAADSDRLYGLGIYEQAGYRLVQESGGTGVEYRVRTKSWGSNTMLFGISLQDDFDGSASFNVNTRLTRVGLNSRGAEWRTDLQLGTEPLLSTEFYQPLMAGSRWFIAPRMELRRSDVKTFEMQEPVSELRISEAEAGLDLGRRLGYKGEVRLGISRGTGKSEVKVGDPSLTNTDFESGGLFAGLRMDTLDDAHFPTRGMQAELWWRSSRTAFGADKAFDAYFAELSKTWTLGRSSLDLGVSYATSSDADPDPQDLFTLGGFQRLSGVQRGAISGPHTALARIVFRRRISDSAGGLLDTPIYLGASLEAGNAWQQRSDISFGSALVNGSVFAGLDTLIGPVFLGAGFIEGGSSNYYLFVGAPPR